MSAKARYHDFCRTAPDVPVFGQPWYLDACAKGGTWDVVLAEEKGRLVAALPFFVKQKGPFRYVTMPPFVKWLGPYVLPEFRGRLPKEHELLKSLLAQLPDFAAFKQNFYPTATNWLPFYWEQYKQTTFYTYRLHQLRNLAQVEAGLGTGIRRDIRLARQTVRVVHDLPLEEFYRVNLLSFARQGLPAPYSFERFRRLDAALAAAEARQLFFAVDAQGRVHSVAYLIWDATTAYFLLAGDDPALRASGAGVLLAWECICYASEVLKLDCFDFEGSMLPGVERIRVRFGAVQTPYFFVWKYNSQLFELLERLKP
ncbi:GNAT family N-acetyltransferase [Microvirga sp. STS02]|uniref:GNAT family N-acetyltransferase n=1 Tax=Hymenobacter negativus TaxID=2795026 RepID=UPI0018DC3685|nr:MULTISPECIES: GNAT family N-acetyltransferase [Bacteria]MBH8567764.1 GNAT family N-acetyltransferase [Hymenobacter negativus]MBR7207498.1 GNAT family N-acetyltransferase [Microvirga sp. STS02]